jgi:RNA polymerase sigma-70 factor, ECF subfamily
VTQSLNQLVDGLRQRDPASIGALVEQFEATGRRLAVALLHDVHLAEDAVQEALFDAVRRIDTLREPAALPAWFRQVVRTQAGRIARRRTEQMPEQLADRACDDASPLRQLEDSETRDCIRRALTRLTPPAMETAELFYLHGYSLAEVAAILGVPTGTIKRRLHDARGSLRDMLSDSL